MNIFDNEIIVTFYFIDNHIPHNGRSILYNIGNDVCRGGGGGDIVQHVVWGIMYHSWLLATPNSIINEQFYSFNLQYLDTLLSCLYNVVRCGHRSLLTNFP